MEELFKDLAGEGVISAVLVWFMLRNGKLVDAIIQLVRNNTEAMTNLRLSIKHMEKPKK